MALAEQDRTDITDLINLHGHLLDAGDQPPKGDPPKDGTRLSDLSRGAADLAVRAIKVAGADLVTTKVASGRRRAHPS
jgi:hypothetical protein